MILAGDVGGTNSRLGLFDDQRKVLYEKSKKNAGRASLQEVVKEFLQEAPAAKGQKIGRACFGVAGPVAGGEVTLTNLNWHLEEKSLAAELEISKVALINDMVAHAEGVEMLTPEHLITLNHGKAVANGNRAIIAAGTGLGESGLLWETQLNGYRAVASEGGHADFAPRSEKQIELLRFLIGQSGSASWENILSGPGTRHIYDFVVSPGQLGSAAGISADPTPADITKAGMTGANAACVATLELFADCYAAEAGNLALRYLAVGGIFIGGGIGVKMLDFLRRPSFLARFSDRGPGKLREMLKQVPIHLINFDLGAVYGAANYASRL